jgi:phytoene synthase
VESDLGEVRVADMAEPLRYCYRVAGTVGLMRTAALDVTVPEALPHAIDLGVAMQLTNICRDVREDALRGRRYLPATLVSVLEPAALIDPACTARAAAVHAVRTLLDLADRHYTSGEQGLRYLPFGARAGILVAARVYRKIGVVLRRRDGDCWSSRARVGATAKAAITLGALGGTTGLRPREVEGMTHGLSLGLLQPASVARPMEAGLGN